MHTNRMYKLEMRTNHKHAYKPNVPVNTGSDVEGKKTRTRKQEATPDNSNQFIFKPQLTPRTDAVFSFVFKDSFDHSIFRPLCLDFSLWKSHSFSNANTKSVKHAFR